MARRSNHAQARIRNLEKARAAKAAKHAAPDRTPFKLSLDPETARELYVHLKMTEGGLGTRLRIVCDTLAAQSFGIQH